MSTTITIILAFAAGIIFGPLLMAVAAGVYDRLADRFGWATTDEDD